MKQLVWQHRKPLERTKRKLQEGRLTVGFIGGSITDGRPRHNWPEPVIAWLADKYPKVKIVVENAAIGGTGSDLAVFRVQRDLIDRGCDLVFVDYAVNDNEVPSERRLRTREGLLRKLLMKGEAACDLVLVHTFCQDMYSSMMEGEVPNSVAQLEKLAEHYSIGSVWMGLYALQQIKRGLIRWDEWLPDGLHPTQRGSLVYAESVIQFLQKELSGASEEAAGTAGLGIKPLIEPLDPANWGSAYHFPLDELKTEGPWTLRRWLYYEWIDQVLETSAVGARLSFSFEGRGIALGFDFGSSSAEFRYRIDSGEWVTESRERPSWVGKDGWFRISPLTDSLEPGIHAFELEVIHGDRADCAGTDFRLAFAGIIQ
ncbi:hypothetical protein D3C81_199400 [compost metagenome]